MIQTDFRHQSLHLDFRNAKLEVIFMSRLEILRGLIILDGDPFTFTIPVPLPDLQASFMSLHHQSNKHKTSKVGSIDYDL
jgi:hypothetical protein